MIWPEVSFESLYAEPARNGIYKPKEFHGSGAKIVNMGELFAYRFIGPQDMARLHIDRSEEKRFAVRDGDLLFARRSLIESGAGKCVIVEGVAETTVFESSLIRVRLNRGCVPRFYFYYFAGPPGRSRVETIITGAAQKGIRGSELARIGVHRPDVQTQRRIASVLSAYDDAIENNRRRIALLQESLRLLYREWFAHLRFPGSDRAVIVDGLPDGWARATLGDLVTLGSGGTPSMRNPDFWGGDVPWISAKDMHGPRFWDSELRLTERALDNGASTAGPDEILILVRGMRLAKELPLGRPMRPVAFNQDVKAIRCGERVLPDFVFQTLVANTSTLLAAVDEAAHGTKRLQTPQILGLPVLLPPIELQARFADEVAPVNRLLANLDQQNARLAEARDALLPRLMNGSIAV